MIEYGKRYDTLDEFRVALGQMAEQEQLNMSPNWMAITADVWANNQCCTCQVGDVRCPCRGGVALAKAGGTCHCLLLSGQNQ